MWSHTETRGAGYCKEDPRQGIGDDIADFRSSIAERTIGCPYCGEAISILVDECLLSRA
jgi:hypothetical protein